MKKIALLLLLAASFSMPAFAADGAEPIYRHSFTTHYLYYDGRRLREILLGIPSPRDAVFTPDGRNIVFSSCNNLYVYNIER